MTKLFLSYGRRDAVELAERLRIDLEKLGYEVWQDTRKIQVGQDWQAEIADGLRSTQIVVALLSPHSVRTSNDPENIDGADSVCWSELTKALHSRPPTPIAPVMAMHCEPPFPVFHLDYVSMVQWKESEEEYQRGFQRLKEGIEQLLSQKPWPFRRWHHCLAVLDFASQLQEKRRDFVGRQWLFDEIDAWRASATRERALLVLGDPGIGKSAFVAEMIHRNPGGQVLAYHICRADDPETLSPATFVMSLAGMIAGRLPAFANLLESPRFQELFDPRTVAGRPAHVMDQGLIAGLHMLSAPEGGVRYLLIDALDEALTIGEGQLNIVKLLSSRVERFPDWLRIVATSRREPDVISKLSGLRAASIDAHRQDNLNDISQFIASRMQTPNLAERLAASRVPMETVQHKLSKKADGNFLYVSQALRDIERDNYSFSRLDELPQGLNSWYEAWFERKFPNPEEDFRDARKILEILVSAQEPLSAEQVSRAGGFPSERELQWTISQFSELLAASDRVEFYHKSIADWLTNCSGLYRIERRPGHEALLKLIDFELLLLPEPRVLLGEYQNYHYVRFALYHAAEVCDWSTYRSYCQNDVVISCVLPLNRFGRGAWQIYTTKSSWDLVQSPEVSLPANCSRLPKDEQVELSKCHANMFFRVGELIREFHSLANLPDYGASLQNVGFQAACYSFMLACSLAIGFLESLMNQSGGQAWSDVAETLRSQKKLLATLNAIDTPRGTGLSGQIEDLTCCVISRWQALAKYPG